MDSVKLYVISFTIGSILSMCMALDCDWKTQFIYRKRCETCPSGEFPISDYSKNSEILCRKCTGKGDHCFCNNTLCINEECSTCSSSPRCKQGEELKRIGLFYFTYKCVPCQNQTYNDEEDKMCKPILDCRSLGLRVIFPGNRTHNARCGCSGTNNNDGVKMTTNGLVVCLAITLWAFMIIIIYLCIQRTRVQGMSKQPSSTSHAMKVPSDECTSCKLSKEEIGV